MSACGRRRDSERVGGGERGGGQVPVGRQNWSLSLSNCDGEHVPEACGGSVVRLGDCMLMVEMRAGKYAVDDREHWQRSREVQKQISDVMFELELLVVMVMVVRGKVRLEMVVRGKERQGRCGEGLKDIKRYFCFGWQIRC